MNLLVRSALHALSRHRVAAIAFGAGAFVLAACESAGTGSGTNPSSLGFLAEGVPVTTPTPVYSFQPYIVSGAVNTKITGINDDKPGSSEAAAPPIVGVSYGAGSNPKYSSFIALKNATTKNLYGGATPYPSGTPSGSSVYISAINQIARNSTWGVAGFSSPFSGSYGGGCLQTSKYCGLIYDPQAPTKLYQVQYPNSGVTPCSSTYLYGTMSSAVQVGYYTDLSCNAHAIEEYKYPGVGVRPQFVEFQLSSLGCNGVQSWAYGINRLGDVVGACTTSSTSGLPAMIGWEYVDFKYSPIIVNGLWTQALGINPPDQVVGSYKDSTGMHGFVGKANANGTGLGTFYTINYMVGSVKYPTVVNSISILQTLVGWYYNKGTSANSPVSGFIATCTPTQCPFGSSSDLSKRGRSTSARGIRSANRQRP